MDKIYYNIDDDLINLLRFYDDGEVFAVTIRMNNNKTINIPDWFTKDGYTEYWYKGNYFIKGGDLMFSLQRDSEYLLYITDLKDFEKLQCQCRTLNYQKSTITYLLFKNDALSNLREKGLQSTLLHDPKQSTTFSFDNQSLSYPIVLIPSKIKQIFDVVFPKQTIYDYLGIKPPILKLLPEPKYPILYNYIETEKIKFIGNPFALFMVSPIIICFLFLFFMSLVKYSNFILSLFFLGAASLFIFNYVKFKNVKFTEKIELSESETSILLNTYYSEFKKIASENRKIKEEYLSTINEFEESMKFKINEAGKSVHILNFKTNLELVEIVTRSTKGRSELYFLNELKKRFGDKILENQVPNSHESFVPDFIYVCDRSNFHIDIEIDEPYNLTDGLPIHYISSADDERNNFFLINNWGVIRFTEKQMVEYPSKCCDLIENVLHSLLTKISSFQSNLPRENRWSYEDSLAMFQKNFRHNYK